MRTKCLAQSSAEILSIQALWKELFISFSTRIMLCDSQSVVAIACNPVFHFRTKHMEIDVFCVWDQVLSKQLASYHVPSLD